MKKKKILFVIESLAAAGSEKSLVSLISVLDKTKFEIDLQLFAYGGEFERYIPSEVKLLPPFEYTQFTQKNAIAQLLSLDFKKIIARWKYSLSIRKKGLGNKDKARLYWKYVSGCIPISLIHYDYAVAYAQNIPTLYVADKVWAEKKIAWINAIYIPGQDHWDYFDYYYKKFNKIVTVSNSVLEEFANVYPCFVKNLVVIKDILDAAFINKLSFNSLEREFVKETPSLLTVARLEKISKGYDITLAACRILKERKVNFKWYAIGRGDYRVEMERYISKYHLDTYFEFLGTTPNPYPYIKNCTLYVQTSRHEGYGLSIAEARILNKPVVTTEFDAVWAQMVQGENGLVVPQDPVAVADAIERLLTDKQLYDHIVAYQQQEKKGNTEEIQKFYRLLEE